MNITRFPPKNAPRLRLIEDEKPDLEQKFDRAFEAIDRLTAVQRDLIMASAMLKHGSDIGPGSAIVEGETLQSLFQVAIRTIELANASDRDLMILGAIRQWLTENGE
jgi:hypothetical protein